MLHAYTFRVSNKQIDIGIGYFQLFNKVNMHSVTLNLGLDDFIHMYYWYLNINKIILIQNDS